MQHAAGVFAYVRENVQPKIKREIPKGSDLDKNVLDAYVLQSLAEAQEGQSWCFFSFLFAKPQFFDSIQGV